MATTKKKPKPKKKAVKGNKTIKYKFFNIPKNIADR